MSYATNPADGTRIAFSSLPARSGDKNAPALMLVHGSALSSAVWRGLGYVAALREHYRVLLPDLRGHGRSDTPHDEDAYAMESIVGDLVAVLDAVGVRQVHYLGYSFGARAGLALAVTAPTTPRHSSRISAGPTANRESTTQHSAKSKCRRWRSPVPRITYGWTTPAPCRARFPVHDWRSCAVSTTRARSRPRPRCYRSSDRSSRRMPGRELHVVGTVRVAVRRPAVAPSAT